MSFFYTFLCHFFYYTISFYRQKDFYVVRIVLNIFFLIEISQRNFVLSAVDLHSSLHKLTRLIWDILFGEFKNELDSFPIIISNNFHYV